MLIFLKKVQGRPLEKYYLLLVFGQRVANLEKLFLDIKETTCFLQANT